MILDDIFLNRKKQVEEQKKQKPTAVLKKEAEAYAAEHPTRGFSRALCRGGRLNVIAEVKKASPSLGVICEDFDPVAIARRYESAGAAALSVLTEETYFQGSAAYLEEIRKNVNLPILRKDFIFDERQVLEARLIGADAVLLIAAMLSPEELSHLLKFAEGLGLEALVETHCEREVEAAAAAGAKIFGVNNRNLKDFTVDLSCAARLAPLLPPDAVFVAESGIRTAADARAMKKAGARAVLVGEALMTSPDIAVKLEELRVGEDG